MAERQQYIPGVCNIGPDEIRKRKQAGWTGLAATIAFYLLLVLFEAPRIFRPVIFLPATAAVIGFLQARMHFCAYFGSQGIFNFGKIGKTESVEQERLRAMDRRKAMQIIAYSIIIGALIALAVYYLPL